MCAAYYGLVSFCLSHKLSVAQPANIRRSDAPPCPAVIYAIIKRKSCLAGRRRIWVIESELRRQNNDR